MSNYKTKPVEIEAIEYDGCNLKEVIEFTKCTYEVAFNKDGTYIRDRRVFNLLPGDFVVKLNTGECRIMTPEVFKTLFIKQAIEPQEEKGTPETEGPVAILKARNLLCYVFTCPHCGHMNFPSIEGINKYLEKGNTIYKAELNQLRAGRSIELNCKNHKCPYFHQVLRVKLDKGLKL